MPRSPFRHFRGRRALLVALPLLLAGCALRAGSHASAPDSAAEDGPPPVMREFRGVWVASVSNIDWPSRPGLPVAEQKAELLAMLDRAAEMRLNAVVLQVRPAADALYPSELEPWSEYLTGEQGRAPEPFYDPLAFAVEEAHRRGLELHAWFNPYRARHPSARTPESPTHIARTRPDLVKRYGGFLWMDPGEPEVQDRSVTVMMDVVRRYDVDGIHIDDYFYPYPLRDSAGRTTDFPDEPSWRRYQAAGGRLGRDDWRRDNVNRFVERIYGEIKREKPWVRFGVSPFGIWRPGHPAQVRTAFDQYAMIYADARLWFREGWLDYFTPQLYWQIGNTTLSYPVLLDWWAKENRHGRHLWPGNFTSRTFEAEPRPWPAREILGQVYVTRGHPGATGNVHFSARAFRINPDSLVEKLRDEAYAEPALVPASPWLWDGAPGRPRVDVERGTAGAVTLRLEATGRTRPNLWVVRVRSGTAWTTAIIPWWETRYVVPVGRGGASADEVAVSAVDRVGNQGPATRVTLGGA